MVLASMEIGYVTGTWTVMMAVMSQQSIASVHLIHSNV